MVHRVLQGSAPREGYNRSQQTLQGEGTHPRGVCHLVVVVVVGRLWRVGPWAAHQGHLSSCLLRMMVTCAVALAWVHGSLQVHAWGMLQQQPAHQWHKHNTPWSAHCHSTTRMVGLGTQHRILLRTSRMVRSCTFTRPCICSVRLAAWHLWGGMGL